LIQSDNPLAVISSRHYTQITIIDSEYYMECVALAIRTAIVDIYYAQLVRSLYIMSDRRFQLHSRAVGLIEVMRRI
jgi:hypothetical protein